MPITCEHVLQPFDRQAFGKLSYQFFGELLRVREDLGRFFTERVYKQAMAKLRNDVLLEVPLIISHGSFRKTYCLDVLIGLGAIIEFKAVEAIAPRHRAQLLHYLILADLLHGMLINVRPESATHEYVNNAMPPAERRRFAVEHHDWQADLPGAAKFESLLTALLHDWGTGLDLALYEEAITSHCGGESQVNRTASVIFRDQNLGEQPLRFLADGTIFKLTSFAEISDRTSFRTHAQRMINHVNVEAMVWANITHHQLSLTTLRSNP